MIQLKIEDGVIIVLTAENERAVKSLLYEYLTPESVIEIVETGEKLQLNDIFSENNSET